MTHMFICLDSHRSLVPIVSLLDDAIESILDQNETVTARNMGNDHDE